MTDRKEKPEIEPWRPWVRRVPGCPRACRRFDGFATQRFASGVYKQVTDQNYLDAAPGSKTRVPPGKSQKHVMNTNCIHFNINSLNVFGT